MTIKELRDQLDRMDDDATIALQKRDGTQMDITKASQQGDHLIFWTDSSS